ncbi:MAG: TPM domain-containing protein [Betaproteobacteria bacterium]|nr:TPM domain-containing protein [Betaproteobacteria bacterium]
MATLGAQVAIAAEGDPLPVPPVKKRVTDQTGTLSAADEARIEGKLRAFESAKGAQVAVLIVPTTQPEAIFDYAIRVAEAWKLGRKGVDDGVLFVVAKNDRKMQILVGPGLQGTLTDAMSKRIIGEIVAPRFRSGDFAGGIEQGLDRIMGLLQGEALPPPQKKRTGVKSSSSAMEGFLIVGVLAALVVGPLLRMLMGRLLGAAATAGVTGAAAWFVLGGLLVPIVVGVIVFFVVLLMGAMSRHGGGWGGGWSTGGGGGDWSGGSSDSFSGGGGSFDGGGASGDW